MRAQDTIASATTCDLGSKDAESLTITGTTTITALGTVSAGIIKRVVFSGALTLTHNATSLILPSGANITTAAGDCAVFESLGSGNWRCTSYTKASGLAVVETGVTDGDKGDITVSASGATWTIDADAVTYAKLQNVSATSRILGRKTAGAGDAEECTLSEVLDFIGSAAQGDILYRGAASWARLAAGTSGQYLKTQGAGANPAWANVATGGVTLLGTITTTSGTTQTLNSLTLTNYKFLLLVMQGVGTTSHSYMTLQSISGPVISGQNGSAADAYYGTCLINLTNGTFSASISSVPSGYAHAAGTVYAGYSPYTTASTSVTVGLGNGSFDAGSVLVYGVA
jgi:hypothetical protein